MNILITGATSGIGKAIAYYLKDNGHNVIGFGRRVDDELKKTGLSWLKMDVTNQNSVNKAIDKAIVHFNQVDILIQCAGRGAIGPIETYTPEDIDEVLQLNVYGIQRVNRAVLPIMRKQGSGRLVFISSLAAEAGLPFNGIYSASKAALDIITESLSMEVKQFGIDACVVQPGDFKTDVAYNKKQSLVLDDSPYKEQFDRISKTTIENVENAGDPIRVAQKIEKIINKKKIKPKYRIGAPIEMIMPVVKNILPSRWFQSLMLMYFKL